MDTVKINLPNRRMYRLHQDDRTAIKVGPGEVEVPAWVAKAWGIQPDAASQNDQRMIDAMNTITERWALPVEQIRGAQRLGDGVLVAFLEMMATIEPGPRIAEILSIEGLSKTSIKAIMKHFNLEPIDGDSK